MRLLPALAALALVACHAPSAPARAKLSVPSGLERVSLLSKGLE
jgi:hypothetical protein